MSSFLYSLLAMCVCVMAQHPMGQDVGGVGPGSFVPPANGPTWWPSQQYVASSGELLPNPGASMFAFQFNGPDKGKNFITLPRSLSADIPRAMTIEAWVWVPPTANRNKAQKFLPLVQRFNLRLRTGPDNLDSFNDFGLQINNENNALEFWMGGQHAEDYGFDIKSSVPVPTGTWTHVAVSVVSSETRNPYFAMLFVDGVQVGSANWKSGAIRVFQTNEAIAVGFKQLVDETSYFEGLIDELRFWGVARKADEIKQSMNYYLDGDEEGLIALYRLDDARGGAIADSGSGANHGYTIKPLWTLGDSETLNRRETGVQDFAVDIALGAVDLVPTGADGFEYTLDCLPQHGCVYAPDDTKKDCAKEADLMTKIFPAGSVRYVGDSNYLGADSFCIRARRVGESDWSGKATIDINVVPAPATGCLTKFDECGVCGGDGTSCTTGGCDGKGGKFDECMVCGGDNSSCQCAIYKTYKISEMDCILFDNAINRTMTRIENSIGLLANTLDGMMEYDPSNPACTLDLLIQVRHLCGVNKCIADYTNELSVFSEASTEYLKNHYLCPEKEPTKLLNRFERERANKMI